MQTSASLATKRKSYENQLLEERLDHFKEDVRPVNLLPYLSCLTETDKQRILADESEHGKVESIQTLVECIKRKEEGFVQFVRALKRTDYGHVALLFDPKERSKFRCTKGQKSTRTFYSSFITSSS